MRLKAAEIHLTQRQKEILERLSNSTHSELHFKIRATIILKAADEIGNRVIAKQMGINRGVATKWRTRYANASKLLEQLEQIEVDSPKKLTEKVKEILSDEYRSGKPSKFTPEQVASIIDLSLQKPESVGVPMTHWTVNALCDKAVELKIVSSISSSQMERLSHDIRIVYTPKHSSWLNQIECWFSIITRRFLNKRASFKSVEELEIGIERFIEFYNEHMAKPFKWTYAGELLHV